MNFDRIIYVAKIRGVLFSKYGGFRELKTCTRNFLDLLE